MGDIKQLSKIAAIGFFFTMIVAINTIFITEKTYIGALFGSFTFNILWSLGVINISKADKLQVVVYSAACGLGCVTGIYLSGFIYNILTFLK